MHLITEMILQRENVRVVITEGLNHTSEKIELREGDNWISVLSSNPGYNTLNFWSRSNIYSKPFSYRKQTKKKLYYDLDDRDFTLNLDYCLEEDNILHIRYKLSNNRTLNLSKILVNYAILLGNDPDYTWVPHLRPAENLVMGDHIYRSPVIIYKKGKFTIAFIPDLKTLGQNRPFQTFIDLNLKPKRFRGAPQISYGFGNYKPTGHVFFKHNPNKKWKIKANTDLTFRYYLIFFIDKSIQEILEFINRFLWEKYGAKLLNSSLEPQVIPYDINAEEGFKAVTERHKLWGDFMLNSIECGGSWQTSWMGKRKTKIKFVDPEGFTLEKQMKKKIERMVTKDTPISKLVMKNANKPFWIKRFEHFTQTFPVIRRNAEIWFNAWFNNMRTAFGFRFFGNLNNDWDLQEKGNRILRTFLNIPQVRGISPTVIYPANLDDTEVSIIKGLHGFLFVDDYSIVDCTLSMYWALKFAQEFDELKEKVEEKAGNIVDLLLEIQYDNGEIPAYIDFESDNTTPIISDVLKGSASSGAPLMLLTEFYKISKDDNILSSAENIAHYLQSEIIPEDKWHDFEPFYSCTHLPTDFYDEYTNKHAMNGLCIYWCAEGMKELYRITNKEEYLKSGERILAILSLFQQVWDVPYIRFHTFGGFCSQNVDAELSDARQGLFIKTYMEYYLLTGKKEYMERAIAGLRGSWAMQFLREYEALCPGNIKKMRTVDTIDRGVVAENYGHSGTDLRIPGYWMPDWGFGTSVTATAYVKLHFGDIFIDFKEQLIFGIDGILLKSFEFETNKVKISADIIASKKYIIFKGRDVPEDKIEISLNTSSLGLITKKDVESGYFYRLIN